MKIVTAKKGGKNRVELIFDDGQIVSLAYEIFLKNSLKINQEISDEFLADLLKADKLYQLKHFALNYISRRAHSKSELRAKLRQKNFEDGLITQTLDELEKNIFIDDTSFAHLFTEEKIKSKRWGKNKIKSELIKRGVDSKIISDVIDEKYSGESEIEKGLELAERKFKQLLKRNLEHKKIQVSIYSFLISRGYDYDSCKQIIGKLFREMELTDL